MRMSCNGCRVLRKGCSDNCSIRPCLQWIKSTESQANATVFLAKFYGRAGLMNLINAGPDHLRPAIFRSLLYEACGRIVNPIYGSVGLLWSGNWPLCQTAVECVLKGSPITQISADSVACTTAPPIKGYDIRHVTKDVDCTSTGTGVSSANTNLHKVKSTRTRFKKSGSGKTKGSSTTGSNNRAAAASPSATTSAAAAGLISFEDHHRERINCNSEYWDGMNDMNNRAATASHDSSTLTHGCGGQTTESTLVSSHRTAYQATAAEPAVFNFVAKAAGNEMKLDFSGGDQMMRYHVEDDEHESSEKDAGELELELTLGLEPISVSRTHSLEQTRAPGGYENIIGHHQHQVRGSSVELRLDFI